MIERRPIVFYERLMHTYDAQVAHLMAAKTSYILFAEDNMTGVIDLSQSVTIVPKAKPVMVEVMVPHKVELLPNNNQLAVKTPKKEAATRKKSVVKAVSPMKVRPGLGLSLDDILSEEAIVAAKGNSRYFKND